MSVLMALGPVGFVGLGDQGGPMALRIAEAGFPLVVWARRAEALSSYMAAGATAATDLPALARAATVIGICVTNDAATIEVFDGLSPGLRQGTTILLHATLHPETCRTLAQRAREMGAVVLDAPVSGGGAAARAGTLTVMAGGDAAAFEAVRPIMASYASLMLRLGDVGAGQTAKLVNNALMAANLAMAHEATNVASSIGIDRVAFAQIVAASSGASFAHGFYTSKLELAGFATATSLLRKDVGLLAQIAAPRLIDVDRLTDPALRFFESVQVACAGAADHGWGTCDA